MSRVREIHREAMRLADEADAARLRGDAAGHRRLIRQAFEAEREAALRLADRTELEPTRSILHKSAAYLALESGLQREASNLARSALAGAPPADVEEELRAILQRTDGYTALSEKAGHRASSIQALRARLVEQQKKLQLKIGQPLRIRTAEGWLTMHPGHAKRTIQKRHHPFSDGRRPQVPTRRS
jgi:hypothetical protein